MKKPIATRIAEIEVIKRRRPLIVGFVCLIVALNLGIYLSKIYWLCIQYSLSFEDVFAASAYPVGGIDYGWEYPGYLVSVGIAFHMSLLTLLAGIGVIAFLVEYFKAHDLALELHEAGEDVDPQGAASPTRPPPSPQKTFLGFPLISFIYLCGLILSSACLCGCVWVNFRFAPVIGRDYQTIVRFVEDVSTHARGDYAHYADSIATTVEANHTLTTTTIAALTCLGVIVSVGNIIVHTVLLIRARTRRE